MDVSRQPDFHYVVNTPGNPDFDSSGFFLSVIRGAIRELGNYLKSPRKLVRFCFGSVLLYVIRFQNYGR
jgi:hypothetical protein